MVVAYDGTNYSGWQIQPNGVTIEQKLNEALQALLGEDIRVTGASRTDAGVHSLGNVCIFDTDTRMPAAASSALSPNTPAAICKIICPNRQIPPPSKKAFPIFAHRLCFGVICSTYSLYS